MRSGLIFGRVVGRLVVVLTFFCVLQVNAKQKRGMDNEAILPQIDVIQIKEASDDAMRTVQGLRHEIAALNARISELEQKVITLSEEVSSVSSAKIEEVETRLALLTEAYKEMHAHIRTLEINSLTTKQPPPKPVEPTVKATFTATSDDLLLTSPEYDLYQNGLRLFNSGKYDEAAKIFADCIAKFPDGRYRDNAWYWIGECNYRVDKMEDAIEAYRNVFTVQGSTKADAAHFKIGLAYQKLGQTGKARAEFRRLIDRYPASEYVERSKKYLADLK